ncbi:ImmA/IrrE family metallo-endopeptidase [Serratia marcescens]|uniref:ImmA/IrrE family metallo-endopeptidase n=1 Tax=Serratia marcescens TaxID=615 RepID=UPI001F3AB4CD|nr:ImmA/IrrE family metallo-endopeptidase [Serratia marcescens]UIM57335.1 ImmA/IrrE family metallo-endopeptidase [Serratia marcescens]
MEPPAYVLRGNRVAPMSMKDVTGNAVNFCSFFNLKQLKKRKKLDIAFERLSIYSITLNVVDDKVWTASTYDLTSGHYDPVTWTISVPNRTFELACKGDREALFVLFHEIGHLVLGHQALLHKSKKPPQQIEDAEWQADTFAEVILAELGFYMNQLSFDFL